MEPRFLNRDLVSEISWLKQPLQPRLEIAVPILRQAAWKAALRLDTHRLEAAVDDHFHAGDEG